MEEPLSPLSNSLVSFFDKEPAPNAERKITVNPVVSKLVRWYERFRTAMEYNEEEVIIRVAIERILRRRLLLGGTGETTAEPLIREMVWGGYFPDDTVPQSAISQTSETIDTYLLLAREVRKRYKMRDSVLNEWMYQLISCEIENILNPSYKTEAMGNFMFEILKRQVTIADDSEEAKDVQVYIAVRRAFHRDDHAFLRFYLFRQYFGSLTKENVMEIAERFPQGFKEINKSLNYPKKETIYNYAKKKAPVFLILQDILEKEGKSVRSIISKTESLQEAVTEACNVRYSSIKQKVRTAIVRSVIFILCTKLLFAFAVEGTYDRFAFGHIVWGTLAINTGSPPLLMILVSFFIKTPGASNTKQIYEYIRSLLFVEGATVGSGLQVRLREKRKKTLMDVIFTLLWAASFLIAFGLIIFVLSAFHFNIVSQFVFIFFLTVVSFLSYRISLVAHLYSVRDRQGVGTIFTDFFFLPIIRVGRQLAQSVQSINFLLYIFDFVFETPFKAVFAFFEQWFGFLHQKREELE